MQPVAKAAVSWKWIQPVLLMVISYWIQPILPLIVPQENNASNTADFVSRNLNLRLKLVLELSCTGSTQTMRDMFRHEILGLLSLITKHLNCIEVREKPLAKGINSSMRIQIERQDIVDERLISSHSEKLSPFFQTPLLAAILTSFSSLH